MKRDTPELLDSCMANYIPGNVETFPRMVFTIFNLSNRNISQLRWSFCENYGVTSRHVTANIIFRDFLKLFFTTSTILTLENFTSAFHASKN